MSSGFLSRAWAGEEAEALFSDLRYPSVEALAWLRANGVSGAALAEPELPRSARVDFHMDRPLFDFVDDAGEVGVQALVFLARDDTGDPSDLVAWSCRRGKVAAHFGAAAVLGADYILAPRLTVEGALWVHWTPLKWLKAGREGVVLIDASCAAVALRNFGPLAAEDHAHGEQLLHQFRTSEPAIFIPEKRAAA